MFVAFTEFTYSGRQNLCACVLLENEMKALQTCRMKRGKEVKGRRVSKDEGKLTLKSTNFTIMLNGVAKQQQIVIAITTVIYTMFCNCIFAD